jgi:hypothetical protein
MFPYAHSRLLGDKKLGTSIKSFRRNAESRRRSIVTPVLCSFALVAAVATLLVLTAIGRVANYSNHLDDMRSRETVSGALKTFQAQLAATLDDYAAWDDAARYVYAADGMAWVISNYGEMSVNSTLFNTAIVIDERKDTVLAYREGRAMDEAVADFFGPPLWVLFDKVRSAGPAEVPEATAFIRTRAGIAAVGVALVREKSGALDVPAGKRRYLIFARPLDDKQIAQLAETYVIGGLGLVGPGVAATYSVAIVDPLGETIGQFVWPSRAPGDISYAQARPLVLIALGLMGLLFVVLLFIGRRLRAEEARAREAALRDRLSGLLNREGMRIGVTKLIERASADGSSVALLYLDLDGFKEINDSYGHGTGDHLIRAIAAGLKVLVPRTRSSAASAATNSPSPFPSPTPRMRRRCGLPRTCSPSLASRSRSATVSWPSAPVSALPSRGRG